MQSYQTVITRLQRVFMATIGSIICGCAVLHHVQLGQIDNRQS